jgi:hypothetical protein
MVTDSGTIYKANGAALTVAALADAKRLPAGFLAELGLGDMARGGVAIPYYGPSGEDIAVKSRTTVKAGDGSYWPKGKPLAAYGQWRIDGASKAGFLILVEGESDCWTLWYHGLPALGLPGANTVKTLLREHVEAVQTVYVHREPDNGGSAFLSGAVERLADLGFKGKAFELRMPDGIKDPADLHAQDPKCFEERLRQAIQISVPLALPEGKPPAKKKRLTLEPFRSFPVESLPCSICEYVRQGAQALGCDPAYLALPALAVAAGLIGYTRVLRLKRTWRAPSVLWTLVVADSGSLKTPAFRHVAQYLFSMQRRLDLEYKRKLAEYAEEKKKWDAAVKTAEHGGGKPPGDEPEPPVRKTVFTSDATIEAIAELIGENPRGLLVACDELAAWLGSFARYKSKGAGTDLPRWLSMHSAGGFAYHRKTGDRRRIVVPHAAVSIAGGIQPGILARVMAGEFLEAGLAGRLLVAMPPRPAKVWSETEIDPETERRYHGLLESLFMLPLEGEEPYVLNLSPAAKSAWVRWYNTWGQQQAGAEGDLAAAFSKLEEAAARFALIHHVVSHLATGQSDLCPVEAVSVESGITLARWFASEARRVYAILAESEEDTFTRRLVEFIRGKGGSIRVKDLQRSNSRKYPTAAAAEMALESLVSDGLGEWRMDPVGAQGGRPTKSFHLLPTTDDTDETSRLDLDVNGDAPDDTSDHTRSEVSISSVSEGFVGIVGSRTEDAAAVRDGAAVPPDGEGIVGRGEVSSTLFQPDMFASKGSGPYGHCESRP